MDELIGEVLHQRYQIRLQLGRKAGRRTLLAVDLTTETQVVIKLLIFNQDFDWQDLKLFEREAETLKSLEHPAIPRYLDYFEFDLPQYRGFALVQTYIDAQSLDLAMSGGRRWSEIEVKQIATDLLKILGYLHSQNPPVIHRDLKPSNILITNRSSHHVGDIYLVDFGSVQNLGHRDGGTMTIVGTYGYMPPEQFGGKAFPASDLFSLGATLIYLISAKHPADLTQDNGKIQFNSNYISKSFIHWLECLTEPMLDRRLQSVSAAQISIDKSMPALSTDRPIAITPKAKSPIRFSSMVLSTIFAVISTAPTMFVISMFLTIILSVLSLDFAWAVVIIPILTLLMFAGALSFFYSNFE